MVKLQSWQWIILVAPIASVVLFLLISAGIQIHAWGLSYVWAIVGVVFVGWRWLLVRWTRPVMREDLIKGQVTKEQVTKEQVTKEQVESLSQSVSSAIPSSRSASIQTQTEQTQTDKALQSILEDSAQDPPVWQDLNQFRSRALELVTRIALIHSPGAKQPLLNIYVPQAYGLLRGTIDDLDQWMEKLSPVLNKLTIAQAYEYYELTQKFAPSAQKVWKVWQKVRWLINPAAAAANTATQGIGNRANAELLGNLSQLLREQLLCNLTQSAIALYAPRTEVGTGDSAPTIASSLASSWTEPPTASITLQTLLTQSTSTQTALQTEPLNLLLLGRTSAGKSSLINTLFTAPMAPTDALPNTDHITHYNWQTPDGNRLILWDTPGYEQADRPDFRNQVLTQALTCDIILLVTPALDPALQMDLDFITDLRNQVPDRPIFVLMTQVDRLRPIREWQPPYHWETGQRPKEVAIRDALTYRRETLPPVSGLFPIVTDGPDRTAWGIDPVAKAIVSSLDPTQQARLARFLTSLSAQALAAESLIARYQVQITTTQSLTTWLKSPVLSFLSNLTIGTPELGLLLATQIPVEQIPLVLGKLQLAYELFNLLTAAQNKSQNKSQNQSQLRSFNLLALWPALMESSGNGDRDARAFGRLMVEYWTDALPAGQLRDRLDQLLALELN